MKHDSYSHQQYYHLLEKIYLIDRYWKRKMSNLSTICPFKLNETYSTLYELQQKLGISDEYLLNTSRDEAKDVQQVDCLRKLLDASRATRDDLVTWHMKEALVELNVTISLLTARIKFIEYKLGLCEGLDLHQACSLSLVNFCNILADMTVLNVQPSERKTMHMISTQVGVPIWLSHYRNQICHVPSESPCISILVPLVIKSLDYMKDSFWSKVLERDNFNAERCKRLIEIITNYLSVTSINHRLDSKLSSKLSKKGFKVATQGHVKATKACKYLRRMLLQNSQQAIEVATRHIVQYKPNDKTKNFALLLEQIILARGFERFVNTLITIAEEDINDRRVSLWLKRVITLVGMQRREGVRQTLKKLNLFVSVKMVKLTEIPTLKCCHIAYRLLKLDHFIVRSLIVKMRHKLLSVLGKKRTILLIQLTNLAKGPDCGTTVE